MEEKRRKRRSIAIIAGAALLLLLVAAWILFRAPSLPPRTAPWYDYSAMLKVLSDSASLRHLNAEELKSFPVLWPTVPVEENAAFYYAKAFSLLKPNGEPAGSLKYAGDLAALETWVAAIKPALDMAAEAQAHPVCRMPIFIGTASGIGTTLGYPSLSRNSLSSLRHLGRCFGDAGLVEELNGRPHTAAEMYLACLRMGAHARHGVLVQSLVGCAVLSIGATPLDRLVANASLPDDDLRKIIQACPEAETTPDEIADTAECEAEFSSACMRLGGFGVRISDLFSGFSRAIVVARKEAKCPIYEVINNPAAQLDIQGKTAGNLNRVPPGCWRWRMELARMDTRLRVLQIRAAIAFYQRQHGKLPATLDALCPQFLPNVPLDPFSGRPLRYSITKEGWMVWSVGSDLKDDGGAVEEADKYLAAIGQNWHGKDGLFVSGVESTIERIRSRTTSNMSYSAEAEAAADAAFQAAHPDADRLGLTPLHRAANRGDLAAVESLLAKGADVNACALAKQTPLHLAVTREIAQLLLSKGAQIEARDRWGRTPLFWAAGAGRKDVVEVLLAGGAQADAPEATDTEGNAMMSALRAQLPAKMQAAVPATQSARTPITHAAEQGHEDIAELLRKHLAEHPANR
jgi:hypothetical protein